MWNNVVQPGRPHMTLWLMRIACWIYRAKNTHKLICSKKLKCSRYRPGVAQRVDRVIALLFHDRETRSGWVVSSTLRPQFSPRGKTRYPFYRRLGGPQSRSGGEENVVPHRDSIPVRPARSSVTIPTELPDQHIICYTAFPLQQMLRNAPRCYVIRIQWYLG